MATDIDSLQIEINAQATKANNAIDKLVVKLDRLTKSLSNVDGSKITGLANGVQRLGTAMQTMNTIKTADFTRLAKNLTNLDNVNTSALNSAASSMSHLTRAFNGLGTVSVNATAVGDLAKNISKLGNKSVQTAVTNIPQLATALNGLMTTLSQAPKVSQNVIQMTKALANLSAQGSKVGSASNSIVKGLNKASTSATKAKRSFKGLASTFGKFYANCFLLIRAFNGLKKSIMGTAEYLEAFNYFEVALNKVGGDWASDYEKYGYESAEAYANSFKTRLNESLSGLSGVQISIDANGETGLLTDTGMKNLGLNIQEVTQYASQLASVANSVGQTGEVTLATASAFTKLGADMSSLFNVDYSSVMNNLQSGLIGQSRALYKYGIDITNATLQTYAYELGVEKAVSEMTQAEKMQLRMIAILDQSRVSWGDQANTINSLSNSIRQFKNNISEAGQVLGQLFVPILTKVMPIVNGLTIAIKRLMVSIASLLGIKLDLSEFGQGASGVSEEIEDISGGLDDVAGSAKKAKNSLRDWDELNVISKSDDGSGTSVAVGGGSIDLTDEILKATSEYEKAWQEAYDRMEAKAQAFADKITNALEPVRRIFKDISIGDWFAVGQDTSNLAVSIFDFFSKAIDEVDWYGIGRKTGDFLAGINWLDVFRSVANLIWQALKAAVELASGIFTAAPFETTILTALGLLKFTGLGQLLFSNIKSAILKKFGLSASETLVKSTIVTPFIEGLKVMLPKIGAFIAANPALLGLAAAAAVITLAVKEALSPAIEEVNILSDKTEAVGGQLSDTTIKKMTPFIEKTKELNKTLNAIGYSGQIISDEVITETTGKLNEVVSLITSELDADKNEALANLNPLKNSMSAEEFAFIGQNVISFYNTLNDEVEKGEARINEILTNANSEKRSLTEQEQEEIASIQEEMRNTGIKYMSESEEEQYIIMRRLKDNATMLSAEQAADIIADSAEARDKAIEAAEQQYDGVLIAAENLRRAGAINDEEYEKMISAAQEAKSTTIAEAEEQYSTILSNIKDSLGEASKYINMETGKINSKWSVFWNDMGNTISEKFGRMVTDVKRGIDAMVSSLKNTKWEWPEIKLPHFKLDGNFSLSPLKVPKVSVDWYANGGVFDTPSVIGVGENGTEAVMPLEHNTGWINNLAAQIDERNNSDETKLLLTSILNVLEELNDKDQTIEINGKNVFNVVKSEARKYKKQTGYSF